MDLGKMDLGEAAQHLQRVSFIAISYVFRLVDGITLQNALCVSKKPPKAFYFAANHANGWGGVNFANLKIVLYICRDIQSIITIKQQKLMQNFTNFKRTILSTLAILCLASTSALAQGTIKFTRTGTTDETVTANLVDADGNAIDGVTADFNHEGGYTYKATSNNITPSILCPDKNGNSSDFTAQTFTVTLNNLPDDFTFNGIDVDIHALNNSGAYQSPTDGKTRQWTVKVQVNDMDYGTTQTDIDIAANCGETGNCHKNWTFAGAKTTPEKTMTVKVIVDKGTTNGGCFFGLSDITLLDENVLLAAPLVEAIEAANSLVDSYPEDLTKMYVVGNRLGEIIDEATRDKHIADVTLAKAAVSAAVTAAEAFVAVGSFTKETVAAEVTKLETVCNALSNLKAPYNTIDTGKDYWFRLPTEEECTVIGKDVSGLRNSSDDIVGAFMSPGTSKTALTEGEVGNGFYFASKTTNSSNFAFKFVEATTGKYYIQTYNGLYIGSNKQVVAEENRCAFTPEYIGYGRVIFTPDGSSQQLHAQLANQVLVTWGDKSATSNSAFIIEEATIEGGGGTAITTLKSAANNGIIYDATGRMVGVGSEDEAQKLASGLYIINGKKYLVK